MLPFFWFKLVMTQTSAVGMEVVWTELAGVTVGQIAQMAAMNVTAQDVSRLCFAFTCLHVCQLAPFQPLDGCGLPPTIMLADIV